MLLSTLTTASAASLPSTSPSAKSASTNTSLLASTNGDSGNILSKRAKAGIGVGVSIGITAILLGILLFILHHRKNRRLSTQSYPSLASSGTSRLGGRESVSRADLDSYGMRIITSPNKDELGGQLQSPGRLYLMPDGRHCINEPGNARMVEQKSFSRLLEIPSDSTLGGDSSDDRQYSELSTSYSGISLVDTRSLGHGSEHALSVECSDIELGEASVVRTQQARVVDDKIPGQEFRKESTTLPGDPGLIRTQ
ncbi:hypothetical protein B0J14DRAFT_63476 [Halenospora varia]|nr:hypothetical protein B0J14DRAFT_63476 [Halenospora varia]